MLGKPATRLPFPGARCPAPVLLPALALCVATLGCGGSGSGSMTSPTDPSGVEAIYELSTAYGAFVVVTNGHPVDLDAVAAAVERGYGKARDQVGGLADRMRFNGYRLVVMPRDWELYGQHLRDRREIRMRVGVERVVAHELQHFFAWELERHAACRELQDHPGGYDLHCDHLP